MTGGFTRLEEVFVKVLPSVEQQSITAIYRKQGKGEYIKYSERVENDDMQAYNKNGLTKWFIRRESTET
jgi:hypothetical protein